MTDTLIAHQLAIVVMGVSGSGKSSVAKGLAKKLGYRLLEGDQLHPSQNVAKMADGIALTDEDRWPWLDLIGHELRGASSRGKGVVATCSALRKVYRDRLREHTARKLYFVFLNGNIDVLHHRVSNRAHHFMPPALLSSQLSTLESPVGEDGVISVDIEADLNAVIRSALDQLSCLLDLPHRQL